MKNKRTESGFTLIELMIVVAIIGILASLALPAYSNYTKKAKFAEVITAVSAVKSSIDLCYQMEGDLDLCDSYGEIDRSQNSVTGGANVDTVTIQAGADTITGTGAADAVDGATYVLKAVARNGALQWSKQNSSTCDTTYEYC